MATTPIKHFMTKEDETGVKFSEMTYCTTSPINLLSDTQDSIQRTAPARWMGITVLFESVSCRKFRRIVRDPTAYFCTQKVKLICGLILFITQEQFHLIITFGHRHSRNNFYWFKTVQTIYELLFVQSSQIIQRRSSHNSSMHQ